MTVQSPSALSGEARCPELGERLRDLELRLESPEVGEARRLRDEIVAQIDDYLLPRLRAWTRRC